MADIVEWTHNKWTTPDSPHDRIAGWFGKLIVEGGAMLLAAGAVGGIVNGGSILLGAPVLDNTIERAAVTLAVFVMFFEQSFCTLITRFSD